MCRILRGSTFFFVGWFFTKTQGFPWAARTSCTPVRLGTERWAHKGRQILILSPPVNIKFLLEIHTSTPQRETLCTPLFFYLIRRYKTHAYTQRPGLEDLTVFLLATSTHPPHHGIKILPTSDTLVIHRHIFNCLLLFSSQHEENHTRSWNQDFPLWS